MTKKLKSIKITGIDGFDANDLMMVMDFFGIDRPKHTKLTQNMDHFWKPFKKLTDRGWKFHHIDDNYISANAKKRFDDAQQKEFDDETGQYREDLDYPGDVLANGNIPGMAEYYIFKRGGKYYSVASNKIEYNVWGSTGDEFEVLSAIHEYDNLITAIKYVEANIKKSKITMYGHHMSIGNQKPIGRKQVELQEAMTTYDADDIFEKYGVKGASVMTMDQLKKAYYKLAIKHHPDKGGSPEAMKNINSAYDVLKNNEGNSYNPRRTDNDNWSNFDTSNDDEEELTAPHIDQFSSDILEKLGRFLEPKLIKFKNPSIAFIQVYLMNLGGPILIITFSPKTNRKVEQFYIRKRGNKIKVLSLWDEYPKQFELTDKNGILEYIKNTMVQKALA